MKTETDEKIIKAKAAIKIAHETLLDLTRLDNKLDEEYSDEFQSDIRKAVIALYDIYKKL